ATSRSWNGRSARGHGKARPSWAPASVSCGRTSPTTSGSRRTAGTWPPCCGRSRGSPPRARNWSPSTARWRRPRARSSKRSGRCRPLRKSRRSDSGRGWRRSATTSPGKTTWSRKRITPPARRETDMNPVKAVNHIGIAVRSIEEQRVFYEGTLGAVFEGVEDVPSQKVRVAFFRVGDVRLELLEPTDPASTVAAFLEKRGEGLHHLAFTVDGLEARIAELKQAGLRMIDEAPRPGAHHMRIAFVHPKS